MDKEYNSLIQNRTWTLVDPPPYSSIFITKWVFHYKYNSKRTLARYNEKFVAKGFTHRKGINYTETFSPIPKMTSQQILFALAITLDYHIHHMEVTTTFLYGLLKEAIYIYQPEGYIKNGHGYKVS